VIPLSPLARGRLTRDWDEVTERFGTHKFEQHLYRRTADADRTVVEQVVRIAEERGVSQGQVTLVCVASRPGITAPIVGAPKPHHLDHAIAALDLVLTPDEVTALDAPYVPLDAPYVPQEITGFDWRERSCP
jgi:1-deoxyxylulose-5-phosphate synthase